MFQILYDGRVSVMLAGHDHAYERFAPLNPSGGIEPARDMRSFVVGTGGAPLRAFGTPRAGSESRNADAKGVLQLVLRADGYDRASYPSPARATGTAKAGCVCRRDLVARIGAVASGSTVGTRRRHPLWRNARKG